MQLSNLIRLGGRSGALVAVVAGMALYGCSAMHQVARLADAAFPEQPSNVDDVQILDVMNKAVDSTQHIDGQRILCRYQINQPREFTCRVDADAKSIVSARLFSSGFSLKANIDLAGKRTPTQAAGSYILEVVSREQ